MRFIVPGGDAGHLHRNAHGAAVVGAVEQEIFEQRGIAGHEAGAQAGHVGAFGKAGEHHQFAETAPQLGSGLQAADGRLAFEVNFGIAFVGGDDETVTALQFKEFRPIRFLQHAAAGVVRRANEHQFHALPHGFGNAAPVGFEVRGAAVGKRGFCPGQERGTFVNLIKRIGAHHHGLFLPVAAQRRLYEGKQGFAAAQHGQDFAVRIEREAVAALQKADAGLAQFGQADGLRIGIEARQGGGERVGNHSRGGVFGLSDLQRHGRNALRRVHALHCFTQAGEGVELELGQVRVHGRLVFCCQGKRLL